MGGLKDTLLLCKKKKKKQATTGLIFTHVLYFVCVCLFFPILLVISNYSCQIKTVEHKVQRFSENCNTDSNTAPSRFLITLADVLKWALKVFF